ncbi:response regulator [Paenibacillus cymbidii]|uniref:response regulator n=1 Tax=Paenibacillus cymbidii TaxID=1639034 RepID=UPI00107FD6D0|nr:response regulator [Paenibacillus cymbidii]
MYRMLIVDDEPIIVEGLYDMFQQIGDWPLELHRAYDAKAALDIARRSRIDILLTDIQMPEMDGIGLQREVVRLWPRCRSIFLTGYDDFDYIQSSLRSGALDYVLKTEGDPAIVAAVNKAVQAISQEVSLERLIAGARSRMTAALPTLRKEYLSELLGGEPSTAAARQGRFAELGIPLDPHRPVLPIVGRVDRWRDETGIADRPLYVYSIGNIFEEYFAATQRIVHVQLAPNRLVWLLQPKDGNDAANAEELHRYAVGTAEAVQQSCRRYLKLAISFVVGSAPCPWEELPSRYERLSLMFVRGLGIESEMLLSDRRLFEEESFGARARLRKLPQLGQLLEQKEQAAFERLYDEIVAAVPGHSGLQTGLGLEIYYGLASLFISYLNRKQLLADIAEQIQLGKLLSIREHATWDEVCAFYRELAGLLFRRHSDENERESGRIVRLVQEYIASNLGGDLSLAQLADAVYLAPFYLSRLYKQRTGVSLTDYIIDARIVRAKELLADTPLKIHEIGLRIGYESAPYFTRFFKRITGRTPQEYRDAADRL